MSEHGEAGKRDIVRRLRDPFDVDNDGADKVRHANELQFDAADEIELLRDEVAWWHRIARTYGYCLGCGAPAGPPHHVYGERKCCPDCQHTTPEEVLP